MADWERDGLRLTVLAEDPVGSARRAAEAALPGGVLYYALGGGLGHLARGLAIARQFLRLRNEPFAILTSCGIRVEEPATRLVLADAPDPEPPALSDLVAALVDALRPAVLAVDAFPAGILGELPEVLPRLPCRLAAVLRRLQPRWVERWRLPELVPAAYDSVALVEPGAGWPGLPGLLRCQETPPVLIRDSAELLPPARARQELAGRVEGPGWTEVPLVCAVVTGARPADLGLLRVARRAVGAVSAAARVRFVTPLPASIEFPERVFCFPLLERLPGVDLVIGAAGYNLYHETAAAGVPAIFIPQARLYDDQFARADSEGRPVARSPAELLGWVRNLLSDRRSGGGVPLYENGAMEVAQMLSELID